MFLLSQSLLNHHAAHRISEPTFPELGSLQTLAIKWTSRPPILCWKDSIRYGDRRCSFQAAKEIWSAHNVQVPAFKCDEGHHLKIQSGIHSNVRVSLSIRLLLAYRFPSLLTSRNPRTFGLVSPPACSPKHRSSGRSGLFALLDCRFERLSPNTVAVAAHNYAPMTIGKISSLSLNSFNLLHLNEKTRWRWGFSFSDDEGG
jgi:hypothetical protein